MEIAEKSKKILELGSRCRAVRKVGELHCTEVMLSLLLMVMLLPETGLYFPVISVHYFALFKK